MELEIWDISFADSGTFSLDKEQEFDVVFVVFVKNGSVSYDQIIQKCSPNNIIAIHTGWDIVCDEQVSENQMSEHYVAFLKEIKNLKASFYLNTFWTPKKLNRPKTTFAEHKKAVAYNIVRHILSNITELCTKRNKRASDPGQQREQKGQHRRTKTSETGMPPEVLNQIRNSRNTIQQ